MDSDDRTHGTQSNCERGNYGAKKKQTFSWEAAGHYSFCLDQKKLSSFLLATTIFIGSRVNDKHPCPSIRVWILIELQTTVVGGRQRPKWEFPWQRSKVKTNRICQYGRPLNKYFKTFASSVNCQAERNIPPSDGQIIVSEVWAVIIF